MGSDRFWGKVMKDLCGEQVTIFENFHQLCFLGKHPHHGHCGGPLPVPRSRRRNAKSFCGFTGADDPVFGHSWQVQKV